MEKSQIWLIVGAIVIVSAIILRIASPTNTWVCEHGAWVAQGNPKSAQPAETCVNDLSIEAELQSLAEIINNNIALEGDIPEKPKVLVSSSTEIMAPAEVVPDSPTKKDEIKPEKEVILISPQANEVIRDQDIITGRALGSWFFEANIPLAILSLEGEVLATGFVQAQGDWMTSEYVPFEGTLNFSVATATPAELVFKKSNSSALPEYEAQLSYPVRLEP